MCEFVLCVAHPSSLGTQAIAAAPGVATRLAGMLHAHLSGAAAAAAAAGAVRNLAENPATHTALLTPPHGELGLAVAFGVGLGLDHAPAASPPSDGSGSGSERERGRRLDVGQLEGATVLRAERGARCVVFFPGCSLRCRHETYAAARSTDLRCDDGVGSARGQREGAKSEDESEAEAAGDGAGGGLVEGLEALLLRAHAELMEQSFDDAEGGNGADDQQAVFTAKLYALGAAGNLAQSVQVPRSSHSSLRLLGVSANHVPKA